MKTTQEKFLYELPHATVYSTELAGVHIAVPKIFHDNPHHGRIGATMEGYNIVQVRDIFLPPTDDNPKPTAITFNVFRTPVGINPHQGTFRGFHAAGDQKIVFVPHGEVIDYIVNIQPESPDFGRWVAVYLSRENRRRVYIPKGFAHGYYTLQDDVDVSYLSDGPYTADPDIAITIRWDDPEIGLELPGEITNIMDRDADGMTLQQYKEFISSR